MKFDIDSPRRENHQNPVRLACGELGKHFLLRLELQKGLLVVAWNHTAASLTLEVLQALCAAEPGRVISRQPALRDTVAPLLHCVS